MHFNPTLFSNSSQQHNSIIITHKCSVVTVFLQMYTRLLQRKLPHKTINNFTADWNDGTLVAALVDAMAPGLCPENEDMDPENAYHNASHAMKLAEDWLEVPQVSQRKKIIKKCTCVTKWCKLIGSIDSVLPRPFSTVVLIP